MISIIEKNIDTIKAACKKHQVTALYLFGSATTGKLANNSDLDFMVEYKRNEKGLPAGSFDYFDFLFLLEDITGMKVDLVVKDAIRNKYFKTQAEKEQLLLYAE